MPRCDKVTSRKCQVGNHFLSQWVPRRQRLSQSSLTASWRFSLLEKTSNKRHSPILFWRDLIRCPTTNGKLPLFLTLNSTCTGHQRLLKDKKLLTPEVDSCPKTSTKPVYLQIDVELSIHFVWLYLTILVITIVILVLWVLLYSPTVYDNWTCVR